MTRSILSWLFVTATVLLTPIALHAGWSFTFAGNPMYGIKSIDLTGMGPEGEDALLLQYLEVDEEWDEYGPGWTINAAPGSIPDPFEETMWSKTVDGPDANNQPPWDSTYPVGHYKPEIWDPGVVKTQYFFVTEM
ncbi:MAG TPA: hypothetical protein VFV87_22380 [Pirellulaceae bacterium]|nr:hypothetical protein [Pirellulaceae bacterium]